MEENNRDLIQPGYVFDIKNDAEVGQGVIANAKRAISMVWEKNVKGPAKFNLIFCSLLVDKDGNSVNAASSYDPDRDVIIFAVDSDSYKSFKSNGLDDETIIILLGAHEAAHEWQFHRGENPIPSEQMTPREYIKDKHEQEAWEEALHVFKKVYPMASGGFTIYDHRFNIPEKSKY